MKPGETEQWMRQQREPVGVGLLPPQIYREEKAALMPGFESVALNKLTSP